MSVQQVPQVNGSNTSAPTPPKGIFASRWQSAVCDALRSLAALSIRHIHPWAFRHIPFLPKNSVLSSSIRGVIFSTFWTGMAVATLRVRREGSSETSSAADYRHAMSRERPPERTNFYRNVSEEYGYERPLWKGITRGTGASQWPIGQNHFLGFDLYGASRCRRDAQRHALVIPSGVVTRLTEWQFFFGIPTERKRSLSLACQGHGLFRVAWLTGYLFDRGSMEDAHGRALRSCDSFRWDAAGRSSVRGLANMERRG